MSGFPNSAQQDDMQAIRRSIMPDLCQVLGFDLIQQPGGEEERIPKVIAEYPCTYDPDQSQEVILEQGVRIVTTGAFYLPIEAYGIVQSAHTMRLIRQGMRIMDPPLEIPVVGDPRPSSVQLVVLVRKKGV